LGDRGQVDLTLPDLTVPGAAMQHYDVGVDLAWGTRAQTGLAVLDDAGHLLDVRTVHTDSEILDWLGPWTAGPCFVAIDSPIVVENTSGARTCERLVASHFGRFGAACHPASTSNPAFTDGGRARRLADALGLDYGLGTVNGIAAGDRRAAEVYPHVAIVVLFGLPHVLRYKSKPRRDLALLREQTSRLLDHLDSLEHTEIPLVTSESQP
jgi:predicted RNase H-like nuclease